MVVCKILWVIKTHFYALITLILSLYSTTTDIKETVFLKAHTNLTLWHHTDSQFSQTYQNHQILKDILLFDYMDLVFFSRKMTDYGRTAEEFKQSFEDGLLKSLEFYRSSTICQSEINELIESNLCANSSLNHQIEKPQVTKINLPMALSSLDQFAGEWHGNWEKMQVHHLWLPVRELVYNLTDEFTLVGFQSCFTGDGFGWNYVVKHSNQTVILGFVIHFDNDGTIISKNPHFAFLNNKDQLMWVSEDHIYNEFICYDSNCSDKRHYVISGAGYKRESGKLNLVNGFQTIYSSNDEDLPAFKSIKLSRLDL